MTHKPVCGCIMKSSAPEPNRENWICAFEPASASVALTWRICLFKGTSSDTDTEYTAYRHKHIHYQLHKMLLTTVSTFEHVI